MWVIAEITPEYEERMMDVLEVYARAYDRKKPVVCLDEKSFQLLESTRPELGQKPGKVRRIDYEYKRRGVVNAFIAVEPLAGQRQVRLTARRTKRDFAKFLRYLVRGKYRTAHKVVLVTDNLNTHNESALSEMYGEKEAKKIMRRLEWHYTPKHASWLNMAEIEINSYTRTCLNQRLSSKQEAAKHTRAWQNRRNRNRDKICWKFTQAKAKLKFRLN